MKRILAALLLIILLVLSGCKAAEDGKVASTAGFVEQTETEQQDTILPERAEEQSPAESEKDLSVMQPTESESTESDSTKSEVPPAKVEVPKIPLTVETVVELSQKGEKLGYQDFEPYLCEEQGWFDRIRRIYEIDDQFFVIVEFYEKTEQTEMLLLVARDLVEDGSSFDLRNKDVQKFIETHKQAERWENVDVELQIEWWPTTIAEFNAFVEANGGILHNVGSKENADYLGYICIDSVEKYRECAGEQARAEYDEAFFKTKSLILFQYLPDAEFTQACGVIAGKKDGKLYLVGLCPKPLGHLENIPQKEGQRIYTVAIGKSELPDIADHKTRGDLIYYQSDRWDGRICY